MVFEVLNKAGAAGSSTKNKSRRSWFENPIFGCPCALATSSKFRPASVQELLVGYVTRTEDWAVRLMFDERVLCTERLTVNDVCD